MSAIVLILALCADADTLRRAQEAFEDGLRLQRAGERSRQRFAAAAEALEELLKHRASPALWRGLGNARLLGGDLPRAILAYRLGLRLAPDDADLRVCLKAARERVAHLEGSALGRPAEELRPFLSPQAARLLAALAWLGTCLTLTRWRMTRARRWLLAGSALLGAALLFAGWSAMDAFRPAPRPLAVVAVDGTVLRKGDGDLFPPRHEQPLNRGVEAEIVHRRGDWLLVEVDGGAGWLHAEAMACER